MTLRAERRAEASTQGEHWEEGGKRARQGRESECGARRGVWSMKRGACQGGAKQRHRFEASRCRSGGRGILIPNAGLRHVVWRSKTPQSGVQIVWRSKTPRSGDRLFWDNMTRVRAESYGLACEGRHVCNACRAWRVWCVHGMCGVRRAACGVRCSANWCAMCGMRWAVGCICFHPPWQSRPASRTV